MNLRKLQVKYYKPKPKKIYLRVDDYPRNST